MENTVIQHTFFDQSQKLQIFNKNPRTPDETEKNRSSEKNSSGNTAERALSYYASNRLMLTNLAWRGTTLRCWDYTIHRLVGVMAQKAEAMHSKILSKWLCNVRLFFLRVWTLETSRKAFRLSLSGSASRLKAVFGYPYLVGNSLSYRQTG